MSVINPDEWRPVAVVAAGTEWAADYHEKDIRAAAAVLCLLDLARYGIRWGTPAPEWVRCVDPEGGRQLTVGKVYRVLSVETGWTKVKNDDGWRCQYPSRCFVPATADEATVTIDVPVKWARWQIGTQYASAPWMTVTAVRDACREALTKAGLL